MRQTYIAQVKAHDNYKLEVKIDYPGKSDGIVIFCHGSGPNTYDNPREIEGKHFNYFDLFADDFAGEALPSAGWNTRGCAVSNHPPDFVAIDRAGYETYCPATSIQDIITVKNYVKALPQFRYAKILLMGISEGATLAPFAAVQCDDIAGLLLAGFSYGNMRDTLNWQLSGGSSMVNMCKYFDCREKGFIEKEDFVRDKYNVRPTLFQDIPFEALDIDGDGKLTQRDFALQLAEYKREVFEAIERNDDTWLRENYPVQITSKWCKEHFALPNVSAMLSRLSVPIYIFQGEDDANVPITEIHHIHDDFHRAGKSNLRIFTFPKHDHDLNYLHYIFNGMLSEGLHCVFDVAQACCHSQGNGEHQ